MEAIFGSLLGPVCTIQVRVAPSSKDRSTKRLGFEELFIFKGGERIAGEVVVSPRGGRAVEHAGIKVEVIGQIEFLFSGGAPFEFTSLVKELDAPGMLDRVRTYGFDFSDFDAPYESYDGLNVRVRYFIRVTMTRNLAMNVSKEQDVWMVNLPPLPTTFTPSVTEVGVNGFLHIEVHLAKDKFHLKEVIIGKIIFSKVKLRIKSMEIVLLKKEKIGSGLLEDENTKVETIQLGRYEIMDGSPTKGESVPIRLFLAQHDALTPSYINCNNQFSVEYFLNVVLIDETNRRYFREHKIELFRHQVA
jgi:vacuolar protein sorting-associated protein 26